MFSPDPLKHSGESENMVSVCRKAPSLRGQIQASVWFQQDTDAATEFQQPAFPVGVEEGVRQIIAIVLWDFERLAVDARVEVLKGKRSEVRRAGVQRLSVHVDQLVLEMKGPQRHVRKQG